MDATRRSSRVRRAASSGRLAVGALVVALLALTLGGGRAARAQALPTDEPSIVVTGVGEASAPAETARIQLLIGSLGFDPSMMGPLPGMEGASGGAEAVPPEAVGTPGADVPAEEPVAGESGAVQGGVGMDVAMASAMMGLPPRVTEEDLAPVIEAIVDAGAPEDAIEVITGPALSVSFGPSGPGAARVELSLADPTEDQVDAIITAADEAILDNGLRLDFAGVGYDVADCAELNREAKRQAIEDAQARAEETAEILGGTLGDLLQASDFGYGPPLIDEESGCAASPFFGGPFGPESGITTQPYDPSAPAEAEAYAQMTLTYAIDGM